VATATFVRPDLCCSSNSSRGIESSRMGWAGHVARMGELALVGKTN